MKILDIIDLTNGQSLLEEDLKKGLQVRLNCSEDRIQMYAYKMNNLETIFTLTGLLENRYDGKYIEVKYEKGPKVIVSPTFIFLEDLILA